MAKLRFVAHTQGPTIARVFFGAGIYFSSLNGIMDITRGAASSASKDDPGWLTSVRAFAAGATARAIAATIMSPVSVVKTRAEWATAADSPYKSTIGGMRHVARTQGVSALYSGLVPTIIRDSPFSGFYYMTYTQLRRW